MRSTALGRHLMRFVSPSLSSPHQSAAAAAAAATAGGASTSATCSSSASIVSLRSSSAFRVSRRSLRAAASTSASSSSRFLAPSALRAMSSGGIGRANVAAAATAAGATEATAAAATATTTDAVAAAGAPSLSSSPQHKRRGDALDAVLAPLEAVVGPLSREPMVPPHAPLVLVVSGPSGVGKDAAIQALHRARPGLRFVVTATSRARRPGEVDGVDYTFVSKNEFERMIESGELLEHAVVYGEYKGIPKKAVEAALEAARRDVAERSALLKARAEAAAEERALAAAAAAAGASSGSLPSSSSEEDAAPPPPAPPLPLGAGVVVLRIDVQGAATVRRLLPAHSCVSVFLVAESEAALAARLAARGTEEPGALATRVATARSEAARASEFDFVVVNAENDVEGTVEALGAIVDAERCRSSRRLSTKEEEETPS